MFGHVRAGRAAIAAGDGGSVNESDRRVKRAAASGSPPPAVLFHRFGRPPPAHLIVARQVGGTVGIPWVKSYIADDKTYCVCRAES